MSLLLSSFSILFCFHAGSLNWRAQITHGQSSRFPGSKFSTHMYIFGFRKSNSTRKRTVLFEILHVVFLGEITSILQHHIRLWQKQHHMARKLLKVCATKKCVGPMNAEEFLRFNTKSQMFKEVVLITVSKDCVTPWPIQMGPHALGAYVVLGARHS